MYNREALELFDELMKKKKKKKGKVYILQDDGSLMLEESSDKIKNEIRDLEGNAAITRKRAQQVGTGSRRNKKRNQKKRALLSEASTANKKMGKERDNLVNKYNKMRDYEGDRGLTELDEEDIKNIDLYNDKGPFTSSDRFLSGLYKKGYSESDIIKMAEIRKRQTNAEKMAKKMAESAKFAEDHEFAASALTFPQNYIGGILGTGETFLQRMKDPHRNFDTNTAAFTLTNKANAARQEVSSDMGDIGRFLYNSGMSIGDTVLAMAVGNKAAGLSKIAGAGEVTSLGSMALRSYTSEVMNLTDRGASAEDAAKGAFAAAVFEVFFEKFSLGNFNALKEVPATSLKGFAKNVAKSMGVNASEEMATETANIIYDTLANGDISNAELKKQELMNQGYSEAEANQAIKKDFLLQIGEAGAAGMLTGGVLGTAGQAKGTHKAIQNNKKIIETEIKRRVEEEKKKTAVDNEIEKIINEKSETFGELSKKEKDKIKEDVLNKIESGELDYSGTALKDETVKKIRDEINIELERGELSKDTIEEALYKTEKEALAELTERFNNAKSEEEKEAIKPELMQATLDFATKMKEALKGDNRLQEIYRQELLKDVEIDIEESETDSDITKELLKSAKNAKMGNTRKSHEIFNFVKMVANDTKTGYGFVNSQQLKELGYEVDDRIINGLVRITKDGKTKVLLNVDNDNLINTVIGHELTHLLEETEEYATLKELVKEYATGRGEYNKVLKAMETIYKDTDTDIESEVTAELIGNYLFSDEKFVKSLSVNEPNAFERIYNWLKKVFASAAPDSEQKKQLLKVKESFEKAYRELNKADAKGTETKNKDSKVKYSFSGEKALNKNESLLQKAKEMEQKGSNSEDIRQSTGWFRGLDKKWRFEIDDSQMKMFLKGDASFRQDHPEYVRFQDLMGKMLYGDINDSELTELRQLDEIWGREHSRLAERVKNGNATLENIIQHDALFNNYPQLRGIRVQFAELEPGEKGRYSPSRNLITINTRQSEDNQKQALIHEIQHAVQTIEGFAGGTSPEYFEEQVPEPEEIYRERLKELTKQQGNIWLRYEDIETALSESINSGNVERAQELETLSDSIYNEHYGENWFMDMIQAKSDVDTPNDYYRRLYWDSAGEIEARDTSNRLGFTEQHRRDIRPDIDNSNAIMTHSLQKEDSVSNQDIKFSLAGTSDITYESLISKRDMKVTRVTTSTENIEHMSRKEILKNAKKTLESKVGKDEKGRTVVFNEDTKSDIIIGRPGIEHGLDRNHVDTAIVSMHLDEYIRNAIKINEAIPDRKRTYNSDILLGYGENADGDKIPAYFVISKLTTGKDELLEFGSLYSLKGKKIEGASAQSSPGVQSRTPSTISISDLLYLVNEIYSDILPKSVAKHYGIKRKKSKLGGNVKYSIHNPSDDIAPLGNWRITGKDIRMRENAYDIAPIRKEFAKPETVTISGDKAPTREEVIGVKEPVNEDKGLTDDALPIREDLSSPEGVQLEANPETGESHEQTQGEDEAPLLSKTRKEIRQALLETDKDDIMDAMENAKDVGSFLMNNTDTIRVSELVFGRKAGRIINKLIFQRALDNESKSIAWQNQQRKDIKALGIKARDKFGKVTKESAAVQKWGEGEYVNEYGDLVKYTDSDLMMEFPDVEMQEKIKNAAKEIRAKYDLYIDMANDVLTGLGFNPIQKRNDYFMHFQELGDFFSRNGIPFNPQSMKENDLPTDINGITEFFVPQKKFFANMFRREGKRTVYDAITGIDRYISSIADLIYHTEDIQRGRAFEDLIRETYGKGEAATQNRLELPEEEQLERLKKQQNYHLSKYVSWLHQWTNHMAGKKNRVDRAIEDVFQRIGFSGLDTMRRQVGANMIGFNISSALTNLIAPVQAMAKTNKVAVARGTADTIRNIIQKDDFVAKNSFLTSRFGTNMLSKNAWQKMQDGAYVFMKGLDWFAANQIVRSKYYELTAKGMSEEQAHSEAGKFAARIMGDRTKGANAMLYNSKLLNIFTQFQLEVNNQIYNMTYDTYNESKEKAGNDSIKTAAGVTFTLGQMFAFTHLFRKTFEAIAGYNPTFDVIGILMTALGIGDDDDDKTSTERLQEAADELLKALPYSNLFTDGGRIPLSSGLPDFAGLITGEKDKYGNELKFSDEMAKLPYLALPAGYGQLKKTVKGLGMFDDDLPVKGSYTDSGNLRYPVEDTALNRIQAGLFGQYANKNARKYFDEERMPLKEKQIQEYKEVDMPINEYWEYRDGLKEKKNNSEKIEYINSLDLPVSKKNILANNVLKRKDEIDFDKYDSYEEFDFASSSPREYAVSKAIGGYSAYKEYKEPLNDFRADKDSNGKSIRGSKKEKIVNYINGLDADYGTKLILYKMQYPQDDNYNNEIVEYLNSQPDLSYKDIKEALEAMYFTVGEDGTVRW